MSDKVWFIAFFFYRLSGFQTLGVAANGRADLSGQLQGCRGSAPKMKT
jgi:hypothetical protein